MANKNFPCKNCISRTLGCHSYCESYNNAKFNYEKEKEEERIQTDVDNFIIQSILKRSGYPKNCKKTYIQKNYIRD